MQAELNWQPETSLEEGLAKVYAWTESKLDVEPEAKVGEVQ